MRKCGKQLTSLLRYGSWEPQTGSQKVFLYLVSEQRYFSYLKGETAILLGETPTLPLSYIFIYVCVYIYM